MGDKVNGTELTRVESYQWPSGHISHLSANQLDALERFKKLCQTKGYYDPGNDKRQPTHDDETLLRYLRARKFIPQEAFGQFRDTEDWRKENQLDKLYETIDVQEYDAARKLYPQWTGRRDKRGIPFYVFEIGNLDSKDISAYASSKDKKKQSTNTKLPWKMIKLFALYENLCRFVLPMCSAIPDRPHSETPISQSSNIVDLRGVGFAKLWSLRSHMSDASTLATAHYPETLDRIFVVGAPSYFPTIWGWVQKWFDPITVSKIFILSQKDMAPTLAKYLDMENVPKKYGGKLDWQFGDMPNLDSGITNSLNWREASGQSGKQNLPVGPIKWQYNDDGDLEALAVGTEAGKQRRKVIAGLHRVAGVAQLALSPGRVNDQQLLNATSTTQSQSLAPHSMTNSNSDADLNVGKTPHSSVQPTSTAGTYTVPSKDLDNDIQSPPPGVRDGTSSTRYAQQEGTHAEGLAESDTAGVQRDGQGERQAVIEPKTVGQAPKEHPVPEPEAEQPSMMDKAKDMAGQAVEQAKQVPTTVMSAVGMGGGKELETQQQDITEDHSAIDNMSGKNVEEFLRSQAQSKPEPFEKA